MLKFVSLFITVLATCHAGKIPEVNPEGMIHLGTFDNPAVRDPNGKHESTDYFIDFQSRNWIEAKQQCDGVFTNGHLLSLDSVDEYKFIKRELEQHGSGKFYFIGVTEGLDNKWIWDGSEEKEVPDFILTSANSQSSAPLFTIIMDFRSEYNTKFVVKSKSDTNPFICEVARQDSIC